MTHAAVGVPMATTPWPRARDIFVVLSSSAFFASPPPPNLSTHRSEPIGVYFSLPTFFNLGVSKSRLDGLDSHDLHGSGISFELSFFSFLSLKVTSN